MASPVRVYLDGNEIDGNLVEWSLTCDEVLGGVGTATWILNDKGLTGIEIEPHQDVKFVIRSSGWVLWHGETMAPSWLIRPAQTFLTWTVPCRDYNGALTERLVGAPDGTNFWRPTATDPYRPIDPVATSYATDDVTVQFWVGHYLVIGAAIDTTTYVHRYIDNAFLGAPENVMNLYDAMTDLQSALLTLASAATVNIQFGLCADDKFRWLAIPPWQDLIGGGDTGDLPLAPYAIGTGGVEPMTLTATKDGQAMPEAVYAQGATTFVLDDMLNPVAGGSGWRPDVPDASLRQAYLAAPGAWSEINRNAIGDSAYRRAQYPTLRGSLTLQGFDGWRPYQAVVISDPRMPDSLQDGTFVIQRVQTTLYSGTNVREYTIDFGDGPSGAASTYATRQQIAPVAVGPAALPPIVTWVVDWQDYGPIAANETRNLVSTPVNGKGDPWGPPGMPVSFVVHATDTDGNPVAAEGSCSPSSTTTDKDGKARTVFSSSTTRSDLYYTVEVDSLVTPAP